MSNGESVDAAAVNRRTEDPTAPAAVEQFHEDGTETEIFDVDLIEIGSFVDENTLFCPFIMQKEKQIQLEIATDQKLVIWTMRSIRSEFRYELHLNDVEDALLEDEKGKSLARWLTLELRVPPKIFKTLAGANLGPFNKLLKVCAVSHLYGTSKHV